MFSRVFNESSASRKLEEGDDSSDIVSPTETTARSKPDVFSPTQAQCLVHLFKDMINGAPVAKPVIIQRLRNDSQAKKMQSDFTVEQVVNRLKYERKQKSDFISFPSGIGLRAVLQESEAKLEMKIFHPPSFFVWR